MGNKKSFHVISEEDKSDNILGNLSIEFDCCWNAFLEQNCIIAKDSDLSEFEKI